MIVKSCRSHKIASYERAHKAWHFYTSDTSSCQYQKELVILKELVGDSLQSIDLSALEMITESLLLKGLNDGMKQHIEFWVDTVFKLHIQCSARFVSNT